MRLLIIYFFYLICSNYYLYEIDSFLYSIFCQFFFAYSSLIYLSHKILFVKIFSHFSRMLTPLSYWKLSLGKRFFNFFANEVLFLYCTLFHNVFLHFYPLLVHYNTYVQFAIFRRKYETNLVSSEVVYCSPNYIQWNILYFPQMLLSDSNKLVF